MKLHPVACLGALALLMACAPSSPKGQPEASASPAPAVEEAALPADEAWVLADRLPLPSDPAGTDGPPVQVGDKVKILSQKGELTQVQTSEGLTGWLPSASLAAGMRRGIVTEEAQGLARLTFVGYEPDGGLVQVVAGPAKAGDTARKAALDKAAVTHNLDDVNLAIQWRLAELEEGAPAKLVRLDQALVKYSSSMFAAKVQEVIEALGGKPAADTEDYSQIATVKGDAEVLSAVGGSVVDHLTDGQQVQTVERTKGETERWYKLADPAGWVSGSTLSF